VIEGCTSPRSVAIVVRGETDAACDDGVLAVTDCLNVVRQLLLSPRVVRGGGVVQWEAARAAKAAAEKAGGVVRLAMLAWAEAVMVIARTLAENAGEDVTATLLASRAGGVWEPLTVARSVLTLATETAVQLVRIDDIIRVETIPEELLPG